VPVLTVTTMVLEVIGVAVKTGWLDELINAVTVVKGKTLDGEITEGRTLDAESAMLESTTLDAEVGVIWPDTLLVGA